MRCARCGYEIVGELVWWWSEEISNRSSVPSNGYYCDGNQHSNKRHIPATFKLYLQCIEKPEGSS